MGEDADSVFEGIGASAEFSSNAAVPRQTSEI